MNDRVIDSPPARLVFRADPLPPLVVALLFAVLGGGLAWLTEGRVYAQWVCVGIAVFAVIDQIQLHLRPPLEIEEGRVTIRPRRGGEIRVEGKSIGRLERRSHGIFGRGLVVIPGFDVGKGTTPETFIGPLRDPAGAWHALERLRHAGSP
ncbi:MAG: hypothetical protein AB7O88_04355 [Reyranellaceae bacterium]